LTDASDVLTASVIRSITPIVKEVNTYNTPVSFYQNTGATTQKRAFFILVAVRT
jgi:hypothetical protein